MCRVAAAAVLVVGVLSPIPSPAEELGRAGEAVVARVERPGGDRYEITVTPPADRGVDRRVMEWLTDTGVAAAAGDAGDDDPVDMSGYRVRVERLASAECSGTYEVKAKPVVLASHKAWVVESVTAASLSAMAFPTKGDVDIHIYSGPNNAVCAKSEKKKQNMDHAGCVRKACVGGGSTNVKVEVGNYTTSQATASAVFELYFVSVP